MAWLSRTLTDPSGVELLQSRAQWHRTTRPAGSYKPCRRITPLKEHLCRTASTGSLHFSASFPSVSGEGQREGLFTEAERFARGSTALDRTVSESRLEKPIAGLDSSVQIARTRAVFKELPRDRPYSFGYPIHHHFDRGTLHTVGFRKNCLSHHSRGCHARRVHVGSLRPWLKSYAVFEPFPEKEYRKVQKLASAIHGKVYLYEHIPTGKAVVVKKMPNVNVIQFDPRMLEDAMTEIGVSRYLATCTSGEFIARAFGIYQDEEFTYFMSEYSSGGELFDHVVNAKQFSEPVAKKYTWQVLRAVKSLHCNGIVHRDISLENTLLHDDGSVRVIDFGQAVLLNNPEGPTPNTPLLHSGRAGKAYYRAPEMYHGHYLGAPADLFAVGVMLFIMTVGTPPWNQASVADARFRYVAKFGVVKLLTSWQRAQLMSTELLDLLEGLMCVDPSKRMTVDEALDHPWFDDCDCEEQPLILHSPRSLTPP
ncbi:hypothetical protein FOZ60_004557 [Perkinsus olseni]|uniref:Protein kinase domain-containing protein n=1 Tax=Perkinsus olseni TaxID=32597 RepID=A0A7J6PGZ8_PEROL|nr:hypothetical protein FOZ60_004557 [Perkinsus olseni]